MFRKSFKTNNNLQKQKTFILGRLMKKQIPAFLIGLSVLVSSMPLTANVVLSLESNTVDQSENNSSNFSQRKFSERLKKELYDFYTADQATQEQYTNKTLSLLLEKKLITQAESIKLREVFLTGGQGKFEEASNALKELREVSTSEFVANIFDLIESDNDDVDTQPSKAGDIGEAAGSFIGGLIASHLSDGDPEMILAGSKLGGGAGRFVGEYINDVVFNDSDNDEEREDDESDDTGENGTGE